MSFSLTRKTDYALVALSRLAAEARGAQRPLSAREIAQEFGLPLPLLMNVLKELHKAQVVCSRRGASGGYMLCCHDPADVSMLQVIEALEGRVKVALCCEEEEAHGAAEPCVACRVLAKCPNVTPMQRFNDMVRSFLGRATLKDVLENGPGLGVLKTGAKAGRTVRPRRSPRPSLSREKNKAPQLAGGKP